MTSPQLKGYPPPLMGVHFIAAEIEAFAKDQKLSPKVARAILGNVDTIEDGVVAARKMRGAKR
jgi:hypothetical protein